ncbi:carbohydrate ABC transporter permease [Sulfobacillus harzensis]|uniref:Carbohydrate ABC transporter permease n=1 Tax=Sulfobacillus harzensis TaxID=2729629 RepID=A0A7Y0L3M8_9FIRM|nr:carbohydrate ABC transporter permease [Sulfobacillus harzensis]NMP22722.1 carbohydrate ABC transporter permease [Sulfobacillus harzensis]
MMARRWGRIGFGVLVAVIIIYSLLPFFWILRSSLESSAGLSQPTSTFWPIGITLSHYRDLFAEENFLRPLINSIVVAGITTCIAVVLGSLAAYALSRLPVKGRMAVLGFVLLVSFFPQIGMVGPLFLIFRHIGWLDTYQSLIFPYLILSLPITTWILTAFFAQIPVEIEEAAMVDGASIIQTIWRVFVPLALPGIFTGAILGFLLSWNDLLFALSFIQSPNMFTVPLALVNFRNAFYIHYGQIDAGVVVASVPIALVVLFLQRRIEAGLTAGGVKG